MHSMSYTHADARHVRRFETKATVALRLLALSLLQRWGGECLCVGIPLSEDRGLLQVEKRTHKEIP